MSLPSHTPITELRHSWGFLVWDPSDGITTREQILMASGHGVETAGLVLGRLGALTATAGGGNTGNGTFGTITLKPGALAGNWALACIQATTGTPAAVVQKHEANVGTGTIGTVTVTAPAILGENRLELTATGATAAFDVFSPAGALIGSGNVGTVFTGGGLSFTLSNGGTMTAGDAYDIIVTDNGVALFSVTDPNGVAKSNATVGVAYSLDLDFTLSQGATKFVVGDTFTIAASTANAQYAAWDPTATNGLQYVAGVLGSYRVDTTSTSQVAGALVRGPARVNASELIFGANVTTDAQVKAALAQLSALGIQNSLGTVALL